MDELDNKIFRALQAEMAVAPSSLQVKSSLRSIAARLGADDMTVNYRYKKPILASNPPHHRLHEAERLAFANLIGG